jgi:hypothetical protein
VYARDAGSAAAPTAGLHFTEEVLARLEVERVTLHVGLDTFRPVSAEDLGEHQLHGERYEVEPEAWDRIRAAIRQIIIFKNHLQEGEYIKIDKDNNGSISIESNFMFGPVAPK